ncbi:hypothetical protein SAMN04487905_101186 [Actinopolyspora xinjiangensis]|uniref:Uncharacterized protein n=1 Tax=Actinopolyspora xinjiangensis TaxID=405564 RepID=A0A1H0NMI7_9ACTN|nr:hypothetical protein SAMN04487905_101186 [Actinopolyspora xinjiangensis]
MSVLRPRPVARRPAAVERVFRWAMTGGTRGGLPPESGWSERSGACAVPVSSQRGEVVLTGPCGTCPGSECRIRHTGELPTSRRIT